MLTKATLLRTEIKSFFLQALWNFEKMQNIGMMFVLMHPLKKIYKDNPEGYYNALKRHLNFFNIHPYMASIVIGIVLSLEEKPNLDDEILTDMVNNIKSTMAGPLSAIGDSFFWGLWRPFVTLFVFLIYLIYLFTIGINNFSFNSCIFIIASFLIIYNIPHIVLKFKGLDLSYKMGTNVIVYIKKWQDFNIEKKVKLAGFLLLAITAITFFIVSKLTLFEIVKIGAIFLIVDILKHKNTSTVKIILSVFIMFLILTYLKVV